MAGAKPRPPAKPATPRKPARAARTSRFTLPEPLVPLHQTGFFQTYEPEPEAATEEPTA